MTESRKRSAGETGPLGASLPGHVSEAGRLSLPVELRRAVGLERGGPVRLELVDGAIRIRTMTDIRDHIRSLARQTGLTDQASVADFLVWRAGERLGEADKATKP